MHESTDVECLIQQCAKRDHRAWSEFIGSFSCILSRNIKNRMDRLDINLPITDIDDIRQHIFLSLWQKQDLGTIRNPNTIKSWLAKVAQNKTVDYIKTENLSKRRRIRYSDSLHTLKDNIDNPVILDEIEQFIHSLDIKKQRVAILYFRYDLKHEQISNIVNLPQGTVSCMIKRIKNNLLCLI